MAERASDYSVPNSDKEKTTNETRDPTQDNNTPVVNVEVKEKPRTLLGTDDKLEKAAALKEKGNEHFKAGDYTGAMKMYHHALLHVKGLEDTAASQVVTGFKPQPTLTASQRGKQVLTQLTCYNNLSVCMLKQEKWERVVMYATQVLDMKPDSRSKPLYRRGTAYLALGNLDGADADLKKAHSMAPDDPAISQQLRLLAEKMKTFREREKKMYSGMFDRKSKDSNKSD